MTKLLSLVEVATYLQITTRHLQDIRKLDSFPDPVVFGKSTFRFREEDIEAFVDRGGCQEDFEL